MNVLNSRVMAWGLVAVFACGGDGKKPRVEAKKTLPEPTVKPEPESEPEKLNPRQWYAKAALTPVKGAKVKPSIVSFSQREGDGTKVESDPLRGAKPGTYWLVIHDGETCGPNATKAGVVWAGADAKLRIDIDKDETGGLETKTVQLELGGDTGAVGHVLVLHDDKKGQPGKALACGVIEEVEEP